MALSHEEYADVHFVYGFCNDDTTDAFEDFRQRYPRRRIPDRHGFTRVHRYQGGKGSFPSVNRRAKNEVQRRVEENENVIDMLQRSPRSNTRWISGRLIFLLMSVENFMYGDWLHLNRIQRVRHLGRAVMAKRQKCCNLNSYNRRRIRNNLFADETHFFPRWSQKHTQKITFIRSCLTTWNCQERLLTSLSVTCGVVSLLCSSVDRLSLSVWQVMFTPAFVTLTTSPSRGSFSTKHITYNTALTERLLIAFGLLVIPKRKDRSKRWTEFSTTVIGTEPIRLQVVELRASVVYAWNLKAIERFQPILSAERRINNASVLCKVVSSLVTQVRKCIQPGGKQLKLLAWRVNYLFLTVHLTTHHNKCTKLPTSLYYNFLMYFKCQ